MKYLTTKQIAEKWKLSQRRVAVLCSQSRIKGAVKAGKTWLIPSTAEKCSVVNSSTDAPQVKYIIDAEEQYVTDSPRTYLVRTELMLDSALLIHCRRYCLERGKTLSEGVNELLSQLVAKDEPDFSGSYPHGFFDLYGSAPELEFSEAPDDLMPEEVQL